MNNAVQPDYVFIDIQDRELFVLQQRMWGKTYNAISKEFDITVYRIKKMETRALEKFQRYFHYKGYHFG